MPANLLHSLVEYTTIDVDPRERVVPLASADLFDARFAYLAGHRLVQFTRAERDNFDRYVRRGGFVFVDDCNHDIDGLFARSFEAQMAEIFGPEALRKIPKDHELYRAFFPFPDGPPATALELNGWGDDLVHDYLKAIDPGRPDRACSTATRTTAASGTTTSATSGSWRKTTPSSA